MRSGRSLLAGGPSKSASKSSKRRALRMEPLERRELLTVVTAAAANDFVNSLGICTRFGDSAWDFTNSSGQTLFDQALPYIEDLGIRYGRNGYSSSSALTARMETLFDTNGPETDGNHYMQFIMNASPMENNILDIDDSTHQTANYLSTLNTLNAANGAYSGILLGVEGPNEYNSSGDPNWSSTLLDYMNKLKQLKTNGSYPNLSNVSIIAPALATPATYGDSQYTTVLTNILADCDIANAHIYTDGQAPGQHWNGDTDNTILQTDVRYGYSNTAKPLWVTEYGYSTGTHVHIDHGKTPITEYTQAKYLATYLPMWFKTQTTQDPIGAANDVSRAFSFCLLDYDQSGTYDPNWKGLLGWDRNVTDNTYTIRPKDSYFAVESLLDMVGDGTWNSSTNTWSANLPSASTQLDFDITGPNASNVDSLLLQKENGEFYLMLWRKYGTVDKNGLMNGFTSEKVDYNDDDGYFTGFTFDNWGASGLGSAPANGVDGTQYSAAANNPQDLPPLNLAPPHGGDPSDDSTVQNVTLTINNKALQSMEAFAFGADWKYKSVAQDLLGGTSMTFNVPDSVMIVKITPAKPVEHWGGQQYL